MYLAILESIAFEQLLVLSAVENAAGSYVKELITIGGGSKSNFSCQIIADITGKMICLPENTEASVFGTSIAAAVGASWYLIFKDAESKMTGIKKTIKPIRKIYSKYKQIFTRYDKIYPGLRTIK